MTRGRHGNIAIGLTLAALLLPTALAVAQPIKEKETMKLYRNGTRPS
ncbi:MAG: hypothetical protein V7634_1504, partial [Bradyrhizobium sp.]